MQHLFSFLFYVIRRTFIQPIEGRVADLQGWGVICFILHFTEYSNKQIIKRLKLDKYVLFFKTPLGPEIYVIELIFKPFAQILQKKRQNLCRHSRDIYR